MGEQFRMSLLQFWAKFGVGGGNVDTDDADGVRDAHVTVFDCRGNIMHTVRINTKDGCI